MDYVIFWLFGVICGAVFCTVLKGIETGSSHVREPLNKVHLDALLDYPKTSTIIDGEDRKEA